MKRLLCTILAAALLLSLCACGGPGNKPTYNDAGYYEIVSVEEDGDILTASDFDSMGWEVFLQLSDDGTGVLAMGSSSTTELTWKDGSISDGNSDIPYTLDGDTLTLDLSDRSGSFVMVFRKGTAPSQQTEEAEEASAFAGFADRFRRADDEISVGADGSDEAAGPDEEKPLAPADGFTPVSADLGDYRVTILAAEAFTDADSKDAVRFYYDFTNNSDEITAPFWNLTLNAREDGYELVAAYTEYPDIAPEYSNDYLTLLPGATVRCIQEYAFRPDGRELTFTVSSYSGGAATAVFDPQDLPGRPGDWTPEAMSDTEFFADIPDEGTSESAQVFIDRAEITDGSDGSEDVSLVRVYFTYTNREPEASFLPSSCAVRAYQDGVELDVGYPNDETESDFAYYEDTSPGATVTVSQCWQLRSDSPVVVAVSDWWTDEILCACTFQ